MNTNLRHPIDSDWEAILGLAQAALPWDTVGNQAWAKNRRTFIGQRRHYVVEDSATGELLAYGALEQGPEPHLYRIFMVMDPDFLQHQATDQLYDQLMNDIVPLKARGLWAREYASDTPVIDFFSARGFVEERRFTLPNLPEMVVLGLDLSR